MSSGLTFVSVLDTTEGDTPDGPSANFIFANYDEAYKYGDWYCRNLISTYGTTRGVFVYVWTASPNSSGRWAANVNPPVFVVFD